MIDKSIDDLFLSIKNSSEYREYLNIGEVLRKDNELNELIEEIKRLQKKSVNLEYNNDISYKDVDKEIEEKVNMLNSNPLYKEYLRRMNNLNDILSESSNTIEKYINEKI